MSHPAGWPATITLTSEESPSGGSVTLTWLDDISIGFDIGGGYTSVTTNPELLQLWLDGGDSGGLIGIIPTTTAAHTGYADAGFISMWELAYLANNGESFYAYGYNQVGSNLIYDGENLINGPPMSFTPTSPLAIAGLTSPLVIPTPLVTFEVLGSAPLVTVFVGG